MEQAMSDSSKLYNDARVAENEGDYNTAFQIYYALAERGHSDAQYKVAEMYMEGKGIGQDYKEALKWVVKSAKQGNMEAQYELGTLCERSEKFNDEIVQRIRISEKTPNGIHQAIKWYEISAEGGHIPSQIRLGCLYRDSQEVGHDVRKALKWFSKAAKTGNANAQLSIGAIYHHGQGEIKQDIKKAESWYLKAAARGNHYAEYCLWILSAENSSNHELTRAFEWLQQSAEGGYCLAQYALGKEYDNGHFLEQDHNKAAYWYYEASKQGNPNAQYRLGNLYKTGKGVKKDLIQACMWLYISEFQGGSTDIAEEKLLSAIFGEEPYQGIEQNLTNAQRYNARELAEEWLLTYRGSPV
jgi:uncharacterized protein